MATHPRDGTAKEPLVEEKKEKRVPLVEVCFREPTKIPGLSMMLTTLVAGERRLVDGKEWVPPPLWFDPVRREICIERRRYPLERVHYYEQAFAAITKTPPPLQLEKYTIGKVKRG